MTTTLPGLFPAYMDESSSQSNGDYTIGGLADSFYEYLLKMWLYSGKTDKIYQQLYEKSVDSMLKHLWKTTANGDQYLGPYSHGDVREEMEHLTCFAGGMLALGHVTKSSSNPKAMEAAAGITQTCHNMYSRQQYGLSPEKVRMSDFQAYDGGSSYYIQRPEAVESMFYMWRLTKEQKYRDWGWEVAQSIEKHCHVDNGYSGINNINSSPVNLNDNQESFFLAETLKYLYLLFSDDSLISLDDYVFNTEAHPIPIVKQMQ